MENRYPHESVTQFVEEVFCGLGARRQDAGRAAEVIVTADLFDIFTHGVERVPDYYAVSYTHLDVYKRQARGGGISHCLPSGAEALVAQRLDAALDRSQSDLACRISLLSALRARLDV